MNSQLLKYTALLVLLLTFANASQSFACANGCNLFDISTSALIPNRQGGLAFVEYDFVNQDQNWQGTSSSPEATNHHKYIKSNVITAGLQYNFNRDWGMTIRVPYIERKTKTTSTTTNAMRHNSDNSLGDIKLSGHYSGFSDDMSTGLIFGVKLPTGNHKSPEFGHRSMQIGTGSTDLIVGAYKLGNFEKDGLVGYFLQGTYQKPIMIIKDYRPGDEVNLVTGINYNFGRVGEFSKVSPLLQLIGTAQGKEKGLRADRNASGFARVMVSPGIEIEAGNFKFYADASLPIYNYTEGNPQLETSEIFKFIVGYKF